MRTQRRTALSVIENCILTKGAGGLADMDLLSIVLGAPKLAKTLFCSSGNWPELSRAELASLNFSPKRIAQTFALVELSQRIGSAPIATGLPISCSADVFRAYQPGLSRKKQEHVIVLSLDNKNRIIAEHLACKGSLNEAEVNPREVFRPLLRDGAARAIVIHNHPSGDVASSPQDIALSIRLCETGQLVNIPILDFIIVGAEGSTSFRDKGLIPDATKEKT